MVSDSRLVAGRFGLEQKMECESCADGKKPGMPAESTFVRGLAKELRSVGPAARRTTLVNIVERLLLWATEGGAGGAGVQVLVADCWCEAEEGNW